ncbi:MAG: hypothetical protein HYX39_12195 [Bacteroidetes bacterium]|nr:hypothetical protein [Bacteroidota bacterium]
MKKIILTLFTGSILLGNAFAQKADCKYQTDETDKFTKKKILWTKWDNFTKFLGPSALVCGIAEGDKKYHDLNNSLVVPSGSKIMILLGDQSTVELKTGQETKGSSSYEAPGSGNNNTDKYFVSTTTTIKYILDDSAIKTLITKNPTSVRVETANGNYDYEFGKKDFEDAINCIIKMGSRHHINAFTN